MPAGVPGARMVIHLPGATGFDRMVLVVVACRGFSVGLVNQLGNTIIANSDYGYAMAA